MSSPSSSSRLMAPPATEPCLLEKEPYSVMRLYAPSSGMTRYEGCPPRKILPGVAVAGEVTVKVDGTDAESEGDYFDALEDHQSAPASESEYHDCIALHDEDEQKNPVVNGRCSSRSSVTSESAIFESIDLGSAPELPAGMARMPGSLSPGEVRQDINDWLYEMDELESGSGPVHSGPKLRVYGGASRLDTSVEADIPNNGEGLDFLDQLEALENGHLRFSN